MKTDELINIKCKMCRSQYKFSINLVYNETMYDNKYNFMYNMIFVRTKLLIGSWLTCQPDHEKLYGRPHYFQILSTFLYDF